MKKTSWILLFGIIFLGVALAITAAAIKMVQEGDTVTVNYTISLDDGTVYYTTIGREPLQETLGEGKFISGFEEAVIGMRVGESKTVTIASERAYGGYRPDLVGPVSRDRLPEDLEPVIGKQLMVEMKDGTQAITVITDINESTVTLDANHPLAGQNLTFDIELVAVEKNQALVESVDLRWALFGLVVIALGITIFYLGRRWRLQLTRVPATEE